MDQKRWQKIELMLDKALSKDSLSQQKAWVKKACGKDKLLYIEVISLLHSIQKAEETNFLKLD